MRVTKYKEWDKVIVASWLAIIALGILMIIRAQYGMDTTDETFYLATAKRFSDGDMLIKDDWNTGQVFGFLLLPLYRGYICVNGSNEGIILFSRILFVALEMFTACFMFRILLKYTGKTGASLMMSACVLVYARGNIINLSYYSVGFLTFVLAILWWAEAGTDQGKKRELLCSGISFAVSVLCMPYMVLVFAGIFLLGVYFHLKGYEDKRNKVAVFGLGVVLAALIFILYYGRWIPWSQLLEYLPNLFQDPTIEGKGMFGQIFDLGVYFIRYFMRYTWIFYVITFAAAFFYGKRKKGERENRKILEGILFAEFLIQSVYVRTFFEGGVIATFFLWALQLQLLYPEQREKKMEKYFLIPGLLFGLIWILGSNVGERVVNMGILMMDVWAVQLVWNNGIKSAEWLKFGRKISVCILFGVLLIIRLFDVYRDGSIIKLTQKITTGIMAGIYTEPQRADIYEEIVSCLRKETGSRDKVVVAGVNPWIYMDTEARCVAYCTWEVTMDDVLADLYYEVFPEKIPDIILVPSKELDVYESWRYSSHGSGVHEGEELILPRVYQKIMEKGDYQKIQNEVITLYKKR